MTYVTGIIHREDIRDDDWILIYEWQLKYALTLNCEIGRSEARKAFGEAKVQGGAARYVRRKDYGAVRALEQCVKPIHHLPAYAFPAGDTEIEVTNE